MKNLNLFVFIAVSALTACGPREVTPSPAAIEVAAQYCARNFKPWFELGRTCKLNEESGKSDLSCSTLGQANRIIGQRWSEGNGQQCSSARLPEMQALLN